MFLTRLAAVVLLLSLLAVSLDGAPAPERKISKRCTFDPEKGKLLKEPGTPSKAAYGTSKHSSNINDYKKHRPSISGAAPGRGR